MLADLRHSPLLRGGEFAAIPPQVIDDLLNDFTKRRVSRGWLIGMSRGARLGAFANVKLAAATSLVPSMMFVICLHLPCLPGSAITLLQKGLGAAPLCFPASGSITIYD